MLSSSKLMMLELVLFHFMLPLLKLIIGETKVEDTVLWLLQMGQKIPNIEA